MQHWSELIACKVLHRSLLFTLVSNAFAPAMALCLYSDTTAGLPSDLKAKEHALKAQIATHSVDASRTLQDSTKASNIQKDTVLVRSPSTILIHNMGKPRAHTSKQLNDYVEALCRKIGNKPPVYLDGDAHFHSIMVSSLCTVPGAGVFLRLS